MDLGILQAMKTVKNNPYVQYVGLGLAALVTQKEQHDPTTGAPLRKSKLQLVRISTAVCGIELCYAAETAFVSPILLKLGVPTSLMTLTWCLSPMLGFFLVPVMGSLSDRCQLRFGRRRPFIILMSVGIVLGLGLVPNGETFGLLLGDNGNVTVNPVETPASNSTTSVSFSIQTEHFRGILFTILGVAMLDFNCDACQSPCRAYLLDVSVPDDHSTGLTTFTVMAGAGGSIGYIMGSIDWNATHFGEALGGHIRVVFSIVLIAFIVCIISTLTSFKEIPLSQMSITHQDLQVKKTKVGNSKYQKFTNDDSSSDECAATEGVILETDIKATSYGAFSDNAAQSPYVVKGAGLDLQGDSMIQSDGLTSKHDDSINTTGTGGKDGQTLEGKGDTGFSYTSLPDRLSRQQEDLAYGNNGEGVDRKAKMDKSDSRFTYTSSLDENCQGKQLQNGHLANSFSHFRDKGCMPEGILAGLSQTVHQGEHFNSLHPCLQVGQNAHFPANIQNETSKRQQKVSIERSAIASCDIKEKIDEVSPYSKYSCKDDYSCTQNVPEAGRQVQVSTDVTLTTYLRSIVKMPRSMWVLCLCNLLCWMSLVCYSLYFTDFVGQSVFGGNPQAPVGSDLHNRYDAGVRLGSLGMSLYSLACACYSLTIERLVQRFRAKRVYMLGQLVFTVGMAGMALSRSKVAVVLLSPTAGIMYATLFTMPYLLVAHYHTRGVFSQGDSSSGEVKQIRGLGTDVAIISSMVFLAQFLLSLIIGTLVVVVGSPVIVIMASCVLSLLGSLTASQITYLDL